MSFYCALILYIQDAIMKKDTLRCLRIMKAVDGFEPTIKLLQSRALPLGYTAITDTILSKKKDSSSLFHQIDGLFVQTAIYKKHKEVERHSTSTY